MTEPPRSPVRIGPHAEAARRSVFDLVAGAIGRNPPAPTPATANTSRVDASLAAVKNSKGAATKPSEQSVNTSAGRRGTSVAGCQQQPSMPCNTSALPSLPPSVPRAHASQAAGTSNYSRKDKSLGVLCEKFIEQYGNGPGSKISLDTASATLKVERRRIYDIINVLESLGCVYREAKNVYVWNTMQDLMDKLEDLKCGRIRSSDSVQEPTLPVALPPSAAALGAASAASSQMGLSTTVPLRALKINSNIENIGLGSTGRDTLTAAEAVEKPSSGTRKDKSLGILCQRFVQLFLLSSNQTVGLDEAATRLSDGTPLPASMQDGYLSKEANAKILKTKVRRLYDIANVLTSLRLIEKVSLRTRKPCFRWTGLTGNKALETLRGEPRHASALARPRPNFRPEAVLSTSLPALKRRVPSANDVGSAPGAASQKGKRGPKRRKMATTGEYAQAPSPTVVEQHLPTEYAAMFKQFVTYAQANGNVNPLDAAAAIANATKAASAAAFLKPTVAQTRSAHDVISKTPKMSPDSGRNLGLMRQPLSSPVSTSDGGCGGLEMASKTRCADGRNRSSMKEDGIAVCDFQSPSPASKQVPGSPAKSVSKRDRGVSALPHSTPKRLMAAQQLSALSQTHACVVVPAAACTPGSNAKSRDSLANQRNAEAASSLKTGSKTGRDQSQASGDPRDPIVKTPVPPSLAQSDTYRYAMSQEAIDDYMCQAREAGPEYEAAANDWLANIRKWQSTWGNLSGMKDSPSPAPSPVTPASNLNLTGGSLDVAGNRPCETDALSSQTPGRT